MRVLLINHFPLAGSGSGVYTLNIARALLRRGHEVCIIMPDNDALELQPFHGMKIHPVYFDAPDGSGLDFNFPCFTTHPKSNMTFEEMTEAQLKAYEGAFRDAIEARSQRSSPTSSIAATYGSKLHSPPTTTSPSS